MSAQTIVRELLRENGPLTIDQLLTLVMEQGTITTKNPKQTIRNALQNDEAALSGGEKEYVYFPGFIKGARLRVPMRGAVPDKGLLPIGPEASALLWPASEHGTRDDKPTIALEGDRSCP